MKTEKMINELIEYYGGAENIPNPVHYPIRFAFLVKSYEHYMKMKEMQDDNSNLPTGA